MGPRLKRSNISFNRKTKGAMREWGGGPTGFKLCQGTAIGIRGGPAGAEKQTLDWPWVPKRENWKGHVTDDDVEGFGVLKQGHELEVYVAKLDPMGNPKPGDWRPAVVLAIDRKTELVAVRTSKSRESVVVKLREGKLRRLEDGRELCSEEELQHMNYLRTRGDVKGLAEYMHGLRTVAGRSHAMVMLMRMGALWAVKDFMDTGVRVTSVALRQLAHAHADNCDIGGCVRCCVGLDATDAALLLVESAALALNRKIQQERERLGRDRFLLGEENEPLDELGRDISEVLLSLGDKADAVRDQPPLVSRAGFTDAFNELLLACGRARTAPLAFRTLEWMERLAVPKDEFTYEYIGSNVAKRVQLLRKVWDLPTAPEEACPEVVFAGRSNVGKSSLVNMLLNKNALAPTSSKPGKTRTMDFFDVNAGHPTLPRFRLVDVPGLGFARASRDMRERWITLIGGYFVQRKSLTLCFHLLDAGLGEILPADRDLWRLVAQAKRQDFELCIALTKADNSLPSQLERFAKKVRDALLEEGTELALSATIFACSSRSKLGKDTLWRKIWTAVGGYGMDGLGVPDAISWRTEEYTDQDLGRAEPAPRTSSRNKIPPWLETKRERARLRRDRKSVV